MPIYDENNDNNNKNINKNINKNNSGASITPINDINNNITGMRNIQSMSAIFDNKKQ